MSSVSPPEFTASSLPESLAALPLFAGERSIRKLAGGRTSTVFLLTLPGQATQIVVKLGREDLCNPLFENRPHHEWAVLCALAQHGVAPMPVASRLSHSGESTLVYQYIPGALGAPSVLELARLLKRLHRIAPPQSLPHRPLAPDCLMQEAERMVGTNPLPHWAASLRPEGPQSVGEVAPCLVHRDPIASNIVSTEAGETVLIDWQCPAIGDPVEDIAHATSPAMSFVYGASETPKAAEMLLAYNDAWVSKRALDILPVYRWRMLCYCHWKAKQGDTVYVAAMEREAADLEQMQTNAHQNR